MCLTTLSGITVWTAPVAATVDALADRKQQLGMILIYLLVFTMSVEMWLHYVHKVCGCSESVLNEGVFFGCVCGVQFY